MSRQTSLWGATALLAAALSLAACSGDGGSGNPADPGEDGVFWRPKAMALQTDAAGQATRLFVVNDDDSLTSCRPRPDGSLADCSLRKDERLAGVNHLSLHAPSQTLLFDQTAGPSPTRCALDAGQGLGACQPGSDGGALQNVQSVAFGARGQRAYAVMADGRVARCAVAGNGSLQSCMGQPLPAGLGLPASVQVLATAAGEFAYFVNSATDASLSVCALSAADGRLMNCTTERGNGVLTAPSSVTFNPAGRHAYIANADTNLVAVCDIAATGRPVACRSTDGAGTFAAVSALAFDPAGRRAYAANALNSTISVCRMAANGGDFEDCSVFTIEDFEYTTDMAIGRRPDGGLIAYIVSYSNGALYGCPLDGNGEFRTCLSTP